MECRESEDREAAKGEAWEEGSEEAAEWAKDDDDPNAHFPDTTYPVPLIPWRIK